MVSPGVGNSAPGLFFKNCSRIAASRSASCFSLPVRSKPCRLSSALFLAFSSFLRAFSSSLRLASSSANLAASSSYCINFRDEQKPDHARRMTPLERQFSFIESWLFGMVSSMFAHVKRTYGRAGPSTRIEHYCHNYPHAKRDPWVCQKRTISVLYNIVKHIGDW